MGLPLGRSTPRPSLRFWGWWDPAATSSGRCVRDINRKARGHNESCQTLIWRKNFWGQTMNSPDARFALMDAEITDLTSSGAAEMVVGPVVFDNFVLDHPGRWDPLIWTLPLLKWNEVTIPNIHFKWLCPIFIRFYMMRKAPSVHPAMSEHYNVWSDLQPNQEKNNSMMPYLLFNRLNWINAMMKENHVAIICW